MSVRNTVKSIQDIMRQDSGVDGDAQRISQLCWMFFLKIIDDQDQQLEVMQDGYRSPVPTELRWSKWAADPEGITGDKLLDFINGELFPKLKELPVSGKQSSRRRVVKEVFEDAYNYMKSGQLLRQVINKINQIDFNNLAERHHFGDIYEQILNDLQSAGNAGEYYTPRAVTAFMVDRIDPHPGETILDPACGTGGFLTCAIGHMRDRYVKKVRDEVAMQGALHGVEKKQLPHMLCVTNMLLHEIEDPSFVRRHNTLARPYISYTQSDRVDIVLTNPPFGGKEEDGIESNFPKHFQTRETADLFLALIIRILKGNGRAAVVLPDGTLFGEGVKTRLKEHLMEECNLHTIVRLPNSVFRPYASIGTNLLFFEKGSPTKDIWYYEHRVPDGQKAYSMTRPIQFEHFKPCIDWWGGAQRKDRKETEVAWKVTVDEVKSRGYNLDVKNPNTIEDQHDDPESLLKKLEHAESQAVALRGELKSLLAGALPKFFINHLPRLTARPDQIKQLRKSVLELAVRGRLVPQHTSDEPADDLLRRIRIEKKRLISEGKLSKQARVSPIEPGNVPFEIPGSWCWVRLGELAALVTSGSRDWAKYYSADGAIFVRMGNLSRDSYKLRLNNLQRVKPPEGSEGSRTKLQEGDILISITGEVGLLGLIPRDFGEAYINQHTAVVRPMVEVVGPYLPQVFCSPFAQLQFNTPRRGLKNSFRLSDITELLVPLPPLAEQKRIVARVDELTAICDELEASLNRARAESANLLESVLHNALNSTSLEQLAGAL